MNYANGRFPLSLFVHLGGDHYLPPGTAARWRWLQRVAWEKYGVWLIISAGWNGYRPYEIQVIYRNELGIWAAVPGHSSHGGSFNGRVVFAIDVANWGLLGWARFAALCRLAGFTVNFVTPEELWHIGDFSDPWAVPAGADSTPFINHNTTRLLEEDDMRQVQHDGTIYTFGQEYVKAETIPGAAQFVAGVLGREPVAANNGPGVNQIDAVCQSFGVPWWAVELVAQGKGYDLDGAKGAGRIWSRQLDVLAGIAGVGGVPAAVALSDADVLRLAAAAADEGDRRDRERPRL